MNPVTDKISIDMAVIAMGGINDGIVPKTWHEVFYSVYNMRDESEDIINMIKFPVESKIVIPSIEEFLRNE